MGTGCDACQVSVRGYTLYFARNEMTASLRSYFNNFDKDKWEYINTRMFWMEETIFFDLIDYLSVHMLDDQILAVLSDQMDPLRDLDQMKPVQHFRLEREASWIDQVITNRAIVTHFQPIVSYEDEKPEIIGHELLSRAKDEVGAIIPPYKMFEAARARNRLFALDRVCRIESVKNAAPIRDQKIFINFIPTAIYVPEHCLSTTMAMVQQMNFNPGNLVFEVIETDEVKDKEHLKSILHYYKSHGFKYALDDVGTGYNDLNMLMDMEPDYVKLAIEFSNGVSRDKEKRNLAESVVKIAHKMNAKALAEGVERKEDLDCLKSMGYDLFQGYYFGMPQERPIEVIGN